MLTKALSGLKITDADQGRVQVVFATFNVKDHDGDVTLPGAFGEQQVRVSAYNHKSWAGALPVGKGRIYETDDGGVGDLQFFLNTSQGRDTFETVKAMGDLQEWSYGYDSEDAYQGDFEGERVQFLPKQIVHEVSPVLLGSGVETRTLAMKGRGPKCSECEKPTTPLFDGHGQLKAAICECGHIDRTAKQLDSDLEDELTDAGVERFGSADSYVWLYDHDVDENFAVYTVCPQNGNGETTFVQVDFTRGDDGSVTLQPGQLNVEPQTTFVPEKSTATPPDQKDTGDGEDDDVVDDIKTADPPKDGESQNGGQKLSEHLASVHGTVDGITTRLADVMAMRAERGKSLGDETRESVSKLADRFETAAKELREVVTSAADANAETSESRLTLEDETQLAELAARHGFRL